ncbi:hypothetical protein [Flavihumibacter profundi]|jgi:hypothetical protein|uniref:hypothetical protein n=1 Tax=Flavihumibacter profundi TaxID=2716883 RepID=UPI001CC69504|nr:hypothetical protein [Flavihumibacter profundi]MBZ5858339.1 hypothetical protein [Flavihumibacter profundi]
MPCSQKVNDCAPCKSESKPPSKREKGIGLLSGIILAVLPKCPFCVLAFSSTMVLCGKGGSVSSTVSHTHPVTLYISLFFCSLTLVSLTLSFKDKRTWYALGLALAGSSCIFYSVTTAGGQALYFTGVLIMLTGIGMNMKRFGWLEKITALTQSKNNSTNYLTKQ